ncbi:phosphate ABC transporter permease subunit PstC [Bacteroidales bacterium OttesenSCG-928-M11]|nr:phosphate ABC transporter permease subunit PstC [Bacteroidales bacterium OttesenSCG-928-M11]
MNRRFQTKIIDGLLLFSSVLILFLLAGMLYALFSRSIPAFLHFGIFDFITSSSWNPREGLEEYGAWSFICTTFIVSILTIIICLPFIISLALFNGGLYRNTLLSRFVSYIIKLSMGIPSIIYGIWGVYTIRPLLSSLNMGNQGYGILAASIVLACMIIPFSATLVTYYIAKVPQAMRETAICMGATRLKVAWKICLPLSRRGIIASLLLALSKVMGEAIIVSFLIGNTFNIPDSLNGTGSTISSIVFNQFGGSHGLQMNSLIALLLILFLFTGIINFIAQKISDRDII